MKKDLVLFDFDGTITRKDSLFEFIKYYHGTFRFLLGFFLLFPWILALKLKLYDHSKVKEKVLIYFFGGEPVKEFQLRCNGFSSDVIPKLCRTTAMEMIRQFKKSNARIIIVSASPENWTLPWALHNNLECIGTKLEVLNDIITGRIEGRNCYGEEKKQRILALVNLQDYQNIIAFGDSEGDREMLEISHQPNFRYFK